MLKRKRRLEWEREKEQATIDAAARRAALQKIIDQRVPSVQSRSFTLYPNKKPPSWR
jgi:hypothetical protein